MSRFRREVIGDWQIEFAGDAPRVVTIYAIAPERAAPPIYVGSTSRSLRDRIRGHIQDARRGSEIPIHRWMREAAGFAVTVLELVDEERRYERERYWVAQFPGVLNLTDGGPGAPGYRWPGDQRERAAARLRRGAHFNCETCSAQFWRKPRDIAKGNCRFCSRACYAASLKGVARALPRLATERGVAAAAAARLRRSACINGHAWSPETTRHNRQGARVCKLCERAASQRHLEARRHG